MELVFQYSIENFILTSSMISVVNYWIKVILKCLIKCLKHCLQKCILLFKKISFISSAGRMHKGGIDNFSFIGNSIHHYPEKKGMQGN